VIRRRERPDARACGKDVACDGSACRARKARVCHVHLKPVFPRIACIGLLAILSSALGAGCTASVQADPVVVATDAEVVVDTVPVNIETYPRGYYEGVVYLVDGRWVYRSGGRWVTYRREPVELGRRRVLVERRHRGLVAPAYRR